jgi:hypothetical protein
MGREELRDGFVKVMNELYDPKAFFDRLDDLYIRQRTPFSPTRALHLRRNWPRRLESALTNVVQSGVVFGRLLWHVRDHRLRREYCRRLVGLLKARQDFGLILYYVLKCAMHYHHYTLARQMVRESRVINTF